MLPESVRASQVSGSQPGRPDPLVLATVMAWGLIVAVTCIHGLFKPGNHSTFPCFAEGGLCWLNGQELYQHMGTSCRYSPLFHLVMIPLAVIPLGVGSLVWRLLNVGVYLVGMGCWMRTLLPADLTPRQKALLFLLPIPLVFGSLFNGQANLLMLGMMLLAMAAIQENRWAVSAFWLVVSSLLKLYPLVLALVLLAIYPRRFAGWFLAFLAVGLAMPYLMHSPQYVTRQYVNWWHVLRMDDRSVYRFDWSYRDLWLLIRRCHLPISRMAYQVIQVGSGLVVAVTSYLIARRNAERGRWPNWQGNAVTLNAILISTCLWLMLCGPATEACTWSVLGPVAGWCVLCGWRSNSPRALKGLLLASYALFLSCMLAGLFPFTSLYHSYGPHPLGGLLLLGAVIWLARRNAFAQAGFKDDSLAGTTVPRAA